MRTPTTRRAFANLLLGIAAAATTWTAAAQEWPSRHIRLIVPVAAGTVTDAAGRLLAVHLKDKLGQPVVVENISGAGATLGALQLSRAAADGYAFMVGGNTTHSAARALVKSVTYDAVADFTPVARVGKLPTLLVTNAQQPFRSIQGMIDHARKHPGKLNYGHGNAVGQIIGESLKKKLQLNIVRVPYASNPPAIIHLIGNEIQLMVPDVLSALPQIQAGKMVPLAVGETRRSSLLPDTPTLDETVIKGFQVLPWFGIFGPKNVPPRIVDRMGAVLEQIASDAKFADSLKKMGIETDFLSGNAFREFARTDVTIWEALAREAGIEPQ